MKLTNEEMLSLIRFLRKLEFFSGFTTAEVDNLLVTTDKKTFKKGAALVKQNDTGRFFFIINSGKVSVSVKSEGKTVKVGELGTGEYFGEMSLIAHAPISATVKAEENTEVFVLYKYDIEMIMKKNPTAAQQMKDIIQRRKEMSSYEISRVPEGFFAKLKGIFK